MTALPFPFVEADEHEARIYTEAREAERRTIAELVPVVRILLLTDRVASAALLVNRLRAQGYSVRYLVVNNVPRIEIRGLPS